MRISAVAPELVAQLSVKSAPAFARYGEGDALRAEVVASTGTSVSIRLESGKVVSAVLRANTSLLAGDHIDLLVAVKTYKGLTLQMTALNGQSIAPDVTAGEQLLLQAGIDASPRNAAFSQALQALSLPVRPATLRAMDAGLRAFPDLPPEQAAFMAANAIEISAPNIETVRTWLQSTPLIDGIAQPVLAYAEATAGLAASDLPSVGLPSVDQPYTAPASLPNAQSSPLNPLESVLLPAKADASVQSGSSEPTGIPARLLPFFKRLSDEATAAVRSVPQYDAALGKLLETPNAERGALALAFLHTLPPSAPADAQTAVLSALLGMPAIEPQPQETVPAAPLSVETMQNKSPQAAQTPAVDDKNKPPVREEVRQPGIKESEGAKPGVRELGFKDLGIKELVYDLFAKLLPDAPSARDLQNAARTANDKLQTIRELLPPQDGEAYKAIAQNLDQLITQNKMGAELNNFYYAQLPFRLSEREQTAELYVLKRDARRQSGKSSYTILMALSTESMGTVESVLKFDNANLQLNFRIGDAQARDHVLSKLPELRAQFASTRFHLQSVTVKPVDEPLTPMTVNRIAHAETGVALGGIDVRV